jgi:hypothetical protein
MSGLERRFQIVREPPPPWTWDQYSTWLRKAWSVLLSTMDNSTEGPFVAFLEKHPCLLPGGEGSLSSFGGHHGGWNDTVISQPPLPGITKRGPDFMWLTKNSLDIIPVLIEIEAPGKPWFRKDGTRSAKLTQALDQLAEWKLHLDNGANRQLLAELYDFPGNWSATYNLVPRLLLIYGRRKEFDLRPWLNQKRYAVRESATDAMTFDRLRPLPGSANAICLKIVDRTQVVAAIPPTFRLGPAIAENIALFRGWENAISANGQLGDSRKEFLIRRIPYWAEMGQRRSSGEYVGPHNDSDWE